MLSDHKPDTTEKIETSKPGLQRVESTSTQLGMAMELPFTFVAAVFLGGLIGYFLDKWLHTGPWLMVVFGCFGFAGGILEIARRFRPSGTRGNNDRHSS
jgi:ATP synthase protein I